MLFGAREVVEHLVREPGLRAGETGEHSDYGFVAARVLDAALQATDGDTSNKDKLAEAMVKVAFDAPRGPFRFDPEVHHPIQDVYVCEVAERDGRLANFPIATIKDVRDPGKKEG